MIKLKYASKLFSLGMILSIMSVFAAPGFSQVSQSSMAQLMVTGKSAGGSGPFVTINGANSTNGSSLKFPAQISVPAETSAVIDFGRTGKVEFSPGTIASLSYSDETGVSVDLSAGRLLVTSSPESNFSIKTIDGLIANDKSRNAIFTTEIVGGATGVSTETGAALVNGVPVRAGEVWTADPSKKTALTKKAKTRKSRIWLFALGAAVGAGIAVAITAAAND